MIKRTNTGGRVVAADRVARERTKTGGRVVAAGGVERERFKTDGGVGTAGIARERVITQYCIAVA